MQKYSLILLNEIKVRVLYVCFIRQECDFTNFFCTKRLSKKEKLKLNVVPVTFLDYIQEERKNIGLKVLRLSLATIYF